jgi:hypothetical protein
MATPRQERSALIAKPIERVTRLRDGGATARFWTQGTELSDFSCVRGERIGQKLGIAGAESLNVGRHMHGMSVLPGLDSNQQPSG